MVFLPMLNFVRIPRVCLNFFLFFSRAQPFERNSRKDQDGLAEETPENALRLRIFQPSFFYKGRWNICVRKLKTPRTDEYCLAEQEQEGYTVLSVPLSL